MMKTATTEIEIKQAVEKLSDFITIMFDRSAMTRRELEEIEEVESVICRYVEMKENEA